MRKAGNEGPREQGNEGARDEGVVSAGEWAVWQAGRKVDKGRLGGGSREKTS